MRGVRYKKWNQETGKKDIICFGYFHQWGLEVDEGDSEGRFNSYSVGIIESKNGQIDTVMPYDIEFFDLRERECK